MTIKKSVSKVSLIQRRLFFFFIIVVIAAALGFLFFINRTPVPRVDLNSGSGANRIENKSDDELVIAFGARISPEITDKYYKDLMNLVASKLGRKAKFIQKRTYSEINELVKNQSVDLAHVCSGPYTMGNKDFSMELLVVPVIGGKKVYHCYIIVNQDSSINSMEELRGKKFAFTDPNSNTGFLVPNFILSKMGESAKSFFRETFFTYSHDNSIRSVAFSQSDGAAVDGIIWEFFNSLDPSMATKTRIIMKSPPYGIPPFVVHPDLNAELKRKLKDIFLTLHLDKNALPLMKKIHIERFEQGDHSMYDTVNEMRMWLDKNK